MSQSPNQANDIYAAKDFQQALSELDQMIFQGRSFSGHEKNCAFLNTASGQFANVSAVSGWDFPDDGRAVGVVDWDQDGDLDLWVVNRTAPQVRFLRNDFRSAGGFLAVRLMGRSSNRDAIGARLELRLKGDSGKLIRTLHGGDGFLSQSSKWIHFGLGHAEGIESLTVRWPGGDREVLTGLQTNKRYQIVEGTGKAELLKDRPPLSAPSSDTAWVADSTQEATIRLAARIPLPDLTYQDFTGQKQSLRANHAGPLLLNLWASWCGPCLEELRGLSQRREELQDRKLRVVALSVDGLGNDESTPANAREFLQRLDFSFPSGMADAGLLERLEVLHNRLIDYHRPFPIPTSFLLDTKGELAAIYKGPIAVKDLLEDLAGLQADPEEVRRRAVPFAGRWASELPVLSRSAIALGFLEAGYPEEAAFYIDQASRQMAAQPGLHDPSYPQASNNLGVIFAGQGRFEEAIPLYRQALAADPALARAHTNLGVALAGLGRLEEAIDPLQQALRLQPDDPEVESNLGTALLASGRSEEATVHLRRALDLNPSMAKTNYSLGLVLSSQRKYREAVVAFREALRLQPDLTQAAGDLAWLLATAPDDALRDGAEALDLAEKADRIMQDSAFVKDVLAAAYAETGDFKSAAVALEEGIRIASAQGLTGMLPGFQERLKLYRKGQPYRQQSP